jgi:hypothetical protein
VGDDALRKELLQRMGANHVQYLQLLDALCYYEDVASGLM